MSTTGFKLASGASYNNSVTVPSSWSGRVWARTGCSTASGKFACATADCRTGQVECDGAGATPPATMIELAVATAYRGQDFYDVSNVDGFNVPVSIAPQGGAGDCQPSSCPADINDVCPGDLQVKGLDGKVIACKSACVAFNQPQYCCYGDYGTPDKCPQTQYSEVFENHCPQAYSNPFDDRSSTFTCFAADYAITFCP